MNGDAFWKTQDLFGTIIRDLQGKIIISDETDNTIKIAMEKKHG